MQQVNKQVGVGTAVIIFNKENKVLLGKRLGSHGHGEYALPGGHLEFGESLEDCAKREVLEETGISLRYNPKLVYTSTEMYDMGTDKAKHYVTLFLAVILDDDQKPVNVEPDKCEGWEWYNLRDVREGKVCSPLFAATDQILGDKQDNFYSTLMSMFSFQRLLWDASMVGSEQSSKITHDFKKGFLDE